MIPDARRPVGRGGASAEMGLIEPGWENFLDFLEFWQVVLSYDLLILMKQPGMPWLLPEKPRKIMICKICIP